MLNGIRLSGLVISEPFWDHEAYGREFYEFSISVSRKSGACDILKCMVRENCLHLIHIGEEITIDGDLRVYTKYRNDIPERNLYCYVLQAYEYIGHDENLVRLEGLIANPPSRRTTPTGKNVTYLSVANYRDRTDRADYIWCVAWYENALRCARLEAGSKVWLTGRLQSREFVKKLDDGELTKTVYEVAVNSIEFTESEEA